MVIYLDNNASTKIDSRVAAEMFECLTDGLANPSSPHSEGRKARRILEDARSGIAKLVGAKTGSMDADRVIFTSGGTEANNLAIQGLRPETNDQDKHIVISAIEHPSITSAVDVCRAAGAKIRIWPVTDLGVIDDAATDEMLDGAKLVSIMLGNNETGVLQPVQRIAQICRERGIICHTDAVQVVGKLPIDFRTLEVDALTISAHKFHGPRGVGVLVLRNGVSLNPILHGGFQQAALRPGTESVALAVGMEKALSIWSQEAESRREQVESLRDRLESQLLDSNIEVVVNGGGSRLPHTTNLSFPGIDRQALLMSLDMQGVCCSTGSACASGSSDPSPVLLAMGCGEEIVAGSLRISLSHLNTAEEIDRAAEIIVKCAQKLLASKPT